MPSADRLNCSVLNFVHRRMGGQELFAVSSEALTKIRAAGFYNAEIYLRNLGLIELTNLKQQAKSLGLTIPSVHLAKSLLNRPDARERLITAIEQAVGLGAKIGVVHLPKSPARLACSLPVLAGVLPKCQTLGFQIAIETTAVAGCLHYLGKLLAVFQPSVIAVTLDLKFIAAGGSSLLQFAAYLADRVVNVHINDYAGQLADQSGRRRYPSLGNGIVNLAAAGRILSKFNYTGLLTLETSLCDVTDQVAELRRCRELMEQHFL